MKSYCFIDCNLLLYRFLSIGRVTLGLFDWIEIVHRGGS